MPGGGKGGGSPRNGDEDPGQETGQRPGGSGERVNKLPCRTMTIITSGIKTGDLVSRGNPSRDKSG